jgi:hypothetical protein
VLWALPIFCAELEDARLAECVPAKDASRFVVDVETDRAFETGRYGCFNEISWQFLAYFQHYLLYYISV